MGAGWIEVRYEAHRDYLNQGGATALMHQIYHEARIAAVDKAGVGIMVVSHAGEGMRRAQQLHNEAQQANLDNPDEPGIAAKLSEHHDGLREAIVHFNAARRCLEWVMSVFPLSPASVLAAGG